MKEIVLVNPKSGINLWVGCIYGDWFFCSVRKNDYIMLVFLWISVEWEYKFMKYNISGRKEFISCTIINSITFLT